MIDSEVEKIINKPHKLRAGDRTREPLRPPEREPATPGKFGCHIEIDRDLLVGVAS